ncbi:MAG: multicopper oxidase domain-containing protein [Myxococcales bacterium]|nr:multicopper oxidase domain-containing protein [Myxococcales bacterium]
MTRDPRAALALTLALAGCGDSDATTNADTTADTTGATAETGLVPTTGKTTDTEPEPTTGGAACVELADGRCVEQTWLDPQLLEPNGDGVYELELRPTEFMVGDQRHCGRAYNGMYPAPMIVTGAAEPGQPRQVRVDLRNAFTRSDVRQTSAAECVCVDTDTMMSCVPGGGHHDSGTCTCTTTEGDPCSFFDFNVTNLHAHGSHVRPDYAAGGGCVEEDGLGCRACDGDPEAGPRECFHADDVISRVLPGEGVRHRWDIDEDGTHHAGLFWYHPHIHGSTAIQVAAGATGAWVVRGPLDEIPGIAEARERVMVFTTPSLGFTPLADGEPCDEDHITVNDFATLGDSAEKQANLLNGVRTPRIVIPPGQVERWRLLHGSYLDEVFLAVARAKDGDCEDLDLTRPLVRLTQIARDGLTLPKPPGGADWPYAPEYVFMSPGYRVEALLDGGELAHGDTLCLMAGRFLQDDPSGETDEPIGITTPPSPEDLLQAITNGDVVAIVNVSEAAGAPTGTEMPDLEAVAAEAPSMMLQDGELDALARCDAATATTDLAQIDQISELWLLFYNTEGFDRCGFPDHNINARNFEHTDRGEYPYDRVFTKGAVDHWRVTAGFDGHPFHIHINPFLVCPLPPAGSPDPEALGRIFEPPFAHWRDTYLVNLNRRADFLTEYRGFTGAFVNHCHKLTHEDHGMMELVRVCDPQTEDCDTLCNGRPCTWRTCAPGDDACLRALAATECVFDPTRCDDAILRCTACAADDPCPPGAHCDDEPGPDDVLRCLPGCVTPDDCIILDTCDAGTCVPAPCPMPCGPGKLCAHGECV